MKVKQHSEIELSIEDDHLIVTLNESDSEGRLSYIAAGHLALSDLKAALDRIEAPSTATTKG